LRRHTKKRKRDSRPSKVRAEANRQLWLDLHDDKKLARAYCLGIKTGRASQRAAIEKKDRIIAEMAKLIRRQDIEDYHIRRAAAVCRNAGYEKLYQVLRMYLFKKM